MRLPCLAVAIVSASAAVSPARATDPGAAMAISDGAALVTSDALRAARAARGAMESGWEAVIEPPPRLTLEPQPVRVPKPQPVARPVSTHPAVPSALGLPPPRHALAGIASFYWQGEKTASGEPFNKRDLTAAHKTLPFGTKVKVHCKSSGRDVVVRINDRGPFKPGRVIDLSEAAAEAIGMQGRGLTAVQLTVLKR